MAKKKLKFRKFRYGKDCRSWWFVTSNGEVILLTIGTINRKEEKATLIYHDGDLIMDARWALAVVKRRTLLGEL